MSTDYTLAYGTHANPDDGRCAMEWVSYLASEPHSDQPRCVSPVLQAFCTALNDSLEDESRQRLRPYLARTIGTADDGFDEIRSWMAMDWLIRTYTPTWLAVAHLPRAARDLSDLPEVVSSSELRTALEALNRARCESRAAWSAALGPVWAVTRTPWAAGRAAAREAAWASAGAAGWAAARVAIGDIAGDRARALAREIGADAAATIGREARTGPGRSAAREAARAALAPIIEDLRDSAFSLLDRMLPTVPLAVPVADAATVASASTVPAI
ncbi:MAG TPA: hypothetical protein VEF89_29845 [Solirubrobacteraceae bacterium]|nr:hypothetical protein [Solirubrobacteraceae bacterium]